jgi:Ca2+-binding RTX toxin-like protein
MVLRRVNAVNDAIVLDNDLGVVDALGGEDIIVGGNSNDTIFRDAGCDSLNGGLNNDIMIGGEGADLLSGSSGQDIFDTRQLAKCCVRLAYSKRSIVRPYWNSIH